MTAGEYNGTVTGKLRPIVTMLTDHLVKDFTPAYKSFGDDLWLRTDEDGNESLVNEKQLQADVEHWLLDLENQMETESDRVYARMCARMIRKNKGWIALLTKRVMKRIR